MGLSPCGESGLKYALMCADKTVTGKSLPMRGEWIEMALNQPKAVRILSLPMR